MKHKTPWRAPMEHPAYFGHVPGAPVVPDVMLLDAVLNVVTGGVGAGRSQVRALKFSSAVQPGEALVIEHESHADGTVSFEITGGERRVASGVMVVGIAA